jgi:hypothetical protein
MAASTMKIKEDGKEDGTKLGILLTAAAFGHRDVYEELNKKADAEMKNETRPDGKNAAQLLKEHTRSDRACCAQRGAMFAPATCKLGKGTGDDVVCPPDFTYFMTEKDAKVCCSILSGFDNDRNKCGGPRDYNCGLKAKTHFERVERERNNRLSAEESAAGYGHATPGYDRLSDRQPFGIEVNKW